MTSQENGSHDSDRLETPLTDSNRLAMLMKGRRLNWIKWLKLLIAVAVIVGLGATFYSAINQWREQPEETRVSLLKLDLALLGIAALLYSIGIGVNFLVLRQAILSLGSAAPWHVILAAQILGHVGKYVPGKAVVVVLRVGALSKHGVPSVPATICVFIETLTMLAVGSALACSLVFVVPLPLWIRVSAVLVAIAATLPTLPPILSRIAGRVTRSQVNIQGAAGRWLFLVAIFWSTISWLLIGGSLAAVVMSIPHGAIVQHDSLSNSWPETWKLFWISTAAIGLAFSVGFVSLLPGGAGVRELVLISMLSTAIGSPHALVATILLRFLFIAVESILAFGAYLWLRKISPMSSQSHSK